MHITNEERPVATKADRKRAYSIVADLIVDEISDIEFDALPPGVQRALNDIRDAMGAAAHENDEPPTTNR